MCVGVGGGVVQYTCQFFFFTIHFNNASFKKCDLSESLLIWFLGIISFSLWLDSMEKLPIFLGSMTLREVSMTLREAPLNVELNC